MSDPVEEFNAVASNLGFFFDYCMDCKKNNTDEWMVGLVKVTNAIFLSMGSEKRIRYKNGSLEKINFS